MPRWRTAVVVIAVGTLLAGCGSGDSEGGSSASADGPGASASPSAPAAEKFAADSGTRYVGVKAPEVLEGLVCDEGDGGFRFGGDLDMYVTGDDGLKELKVAGEDVADTISCFGSPRITLRKGTMSASAPVFTARTNLYEQIADPVTSLKTIFERSVILSESYGRNFTGELQEVTSSDLLLKCRQNVSDTFPMTTCFWANYGAAGVLDFFPPDGQAVPIQSAARLTKDFVAAALKPRA
ncbi:hypothetical protein [Streptomyces sp. TRM49041]|uniref:hypothetical protein n=1 Tax=Streptomyces sp. TRM49041 TaxID=2603216 RepID=UPI0011EF8E71|nr:hypothetical protein [Streptomyces sp. TRM49041]